MEQPIDHLLLVDDDREIRALVSEQLTAAGYSVTTAADGAEMRRALGRGAFDLMILDLTLPREDGLALCREVRGQSTLPIIMLTARGEPIDRILGLEMGADDYLAKPFEPRELLARIRSVLRRSRAVPSNMEPLPARQARFSGWLLDFERRHLLDPSGRTVVLSGAEHRMLRVLLNHPNRVLSREQLLALGAVRQGEDRAIDLQVSRLRQKLGEDPKAPRLIQTVRAEGYVLAARVDLQ